MFKSYILSLFLLFFLFACKKESPVNEGITLLGGTEWRGKANTNLAVDKKTHYYVCQFRQDGTVRIAKADQAGMIFEEEAIGTYKYEAPYITIESKGGGYIFIYREHPDVHIFSEHFDVEMYKQ